MTEEQEQMYEETLSKIHAFGKFGSKLGLSRMRALMELLGNPEKEMKVIHVAGTNGKGSVCRYLYSVLRENGYRPGLYTSPYIQRFTERIEFDGSEISGEDLTSCMEPVFAAVEKMRSQGLESPTEFEVVTAGAFVYFSRKQADYLVLEVGLGGKGDSTNIVENPLISVITSISYDHMDYLGNTLEDIAREKAGIIKEGISLVYNVGDQEAEKAILACAKEKRSTCVKVDTVPFDISSSRDGARFSAEICGNQYNGVELSMGGYHQIQNALCALTVLEFLGKENKICLEREKLLAGMKKARQPGRFEILSESPVILIDGAHNAAGAAAFADAVNTHFKGQRVLLVLGMLRDKEVAEMIREFGRVGGDILTTEPDNPRKFSSHELAAKVAGEGFTCLDGGSVDQTITYVKSHLKDYDLVAFAGSLYMIGKIRGEFSNGKQ